MKDLRECTLAEAVEELRNARARMDSGAAFSLNVPSLTHACIMWLELPEEHPEKWGSALHEIYGPQGERPFFQSGYNIPTLTHALRSAGFTHVSVIERDGILIASAFA